MKLPWSIHSVCPCGRDNFLPLVEHAENGTFFLSHGVFILGPDIISSTQLRHLWIKCINLSSICSQKRKRGKEALKKAIHPRFDSSLRVQCHDQSKPAWDVMLLKWLPSISLPSSSCTALPVVSLAIRPQFIENDLCAFLFVQKKKNTQCPSSWFDSHHNYHHQH